MNERLNELMIQAGYAAPEMEGRAHKLAQLIVEECVKAVDLTNTHHVHTTFDDNLVRTTMSKTKTAIKQHFGVE